MPKKHNPLLVAGVSVFVILIPLTCVWWYIFVRNDRISEAMKMNEFIITERDGINLFNTAGSFLKDSFAISSQKNDSNIDTKNAIKSNNKEFAYIKKQRNITAKKKFDKAVIKMQRIDSGLSLFQKRIADIKDRVSDEKSLEN